MYGDGLMDMKVYFLRAPHFDISSVFITAAAEKKLKPLVTSLTSASRRRVEPTVRV